MFNTQDWKEIGNNMYNTFKSWFWPNENPKIYNPGQKVFTFFHFLTHRTAIPQIWYHYGPSPHPSLVNVVQAGSEMIQLDLNIVFWGERGVFVVAKCFQKLYLKTKHGNIHFS